MAKTKKEKPVADDNSVGEPLVEIDGITIYRAQVIRYKKTVGGVISTGQAEKVKTVGEDSVWIFVRDVVSGEEDWISLNVQLDTFSSVKEMVDVK